MMDQGSNIQNLRKVIKIDIIVAKLKIKIIINVNKHFDKDGPVDLIQGFNDS